MRCTRATRSIKGMTQGLDGQRGDERLLKAVLVASTITS